VIILIIVVAYLSNIVLIVLNIVILSSLALRGKLLVHTHVVLALPELLPVLVMRIKAVALTLMSAQLALIIAILTNFATTREEVLIVVPVTLVGQWEDH